MKNKFLTSSFVFVKFLFNLMIPTLMIPALMVPVALGFLVGCATPSKTKRPSNTGTFHGSLEKVMAAAEKAIGRYPVSESNPEVGILKSDYLKGDDCFKSPNSEEFYSAGVRCQLTLYFSKISKSKTKVQIRKNLEIIRDFISEPESLPDNGLEELTILYRIERELNLNEAYGQSSESLD